MYINGTFLQFLFLKTQRPGLAPAVAFVGIKSSQMIFWREKIDGGEIKVILLNAKAYRSFSPLSAILENTKLVLKPAAAVNFARLSASY